MSTKEGGAATWGSYRLTKFNKQVTQSQHASKDTEVFGLAVSLQ